MSEPLARRRVPPPAAAAASTGETGDGADASNANATDSDANALTMSTTYTLSALMEEINDRLKILNYENDLLRAKPHLALKTLHRQYFCIATSPSLQFPYYSHLMSWLFSLVGRETLDVNEFDDPSTISASIFEHLKVLGAPCDYQPSRLRHGSGDAVIHSLDFLTSLALKKRSFRGLSPDYSLAAATEDSSAPAMPASSTAGQEASIADDEDEIVDTIDEEAVMADFEQDEVAPNDAFAAVSQHIAPVANVTSKEAAAWALEVEQVSSKLKAAPVNTTTKEWRGHSEQLTKHEKLLGDTIAPVNKDLERMSTLLTKTLERITHREKTVNRDYESLASEMRELQHQYEAQQTSYKELSAELASLSERYRESVAELETSKERIERRNDQMMDATPVRVMQQTTKAMKAEISEMEVKIGIVSQCLLAARQRQWAEKGRAANREERDRQRRGAGGNRAQQKPTAVRY